MKKFNAVLIILLIGFSLSSIASEECSKPSFMRSTQQRLKETAKWYGLGYGALHAFTIGALIPFAALMETDFDRFMAKEKGESLSLKKTVLTFGNYSREAFFDFNKAIFRTHRVAAPVVFGSAIAWHTYKEKFSDKE